MKTTSTYSEALNRILDAYQNIGEEIPLLVDFELFAANPHLKQILGMIYKDILDFHMEAVRYFRKSCESLHMIILFSFFFFSPSHAAEEILELWNHIICVVYVPQVFFNRVPPSSNSLC
jgi:hypothetical protein